MRPPMVVGVADLHHRPGARRHERLSARLPGLRVVDTVVPDDAEVDLDLDLEAVTGGILASGTATAPWEAPCRRCTRVARGTATARFRELFEPAPRDDETYRLGHEQLDLEPLAREAVLLELPLAPLCDEQCRGLCPTCGAALDEGPCACVPDDRDPRWAALDALLTEDERAD